MFAQASPVSDRSQRDLDLSKSIEARLELEAELKRLEVDRQRATYRLECLRLAKEMASGSRDARTIVADAQTLMDFLTGAAS